MPIRPEKLAEPQNAHVALKHNATWLMAVQILTQRGGNPAWHLVVRNANGQYLAATFARIAQQGDVAPDTAVADLPGLALVETVDAAAMSTGDAEQYVHGLRTAVKLIVVQHGSRFAGIVSAGSSRSGELPSPQLDRLAGQTVDLSQLGDLLLDDE